MSLLEQLQQKRNALKLTTTIVTTPTGERYIERGDAPAIKLEPHQYGFVVDNKPDTIPACIMKDFLYLGSQDSVSTENVANFGLTNVLSIGVPTPNTTELPQTVHCKYLECLDLPETILFANIVPQAMEYINTVRSTNGRVLVHCNAGVSRSASVVIAYLMLQHAMCFEEAYKLVKTARECIQPNIGFMKQLKTYTLS